MIELIFFTVLAGICSIAAGGAFHDKLPGWFPISLKIPSQITLALLCNHILDGNWWTLTLVLWMPFARQVFGTGNPLGKIIIGHTAHREGLALRGMTEEDDLEKWQITNNAWWSVSMLGVWYVLPCIAYGIWLDPLWFLIPIIIAVAFPMAGILSRKFKTDNQWMFIEFGYWSITMFFLQLAIY